MSALQDMLQRSQGASASQQPALISAYEAEQAIQQLRVTAIEQVGDDKFLRQHDSIQKLNLQAHWNAQCHSDEFVLDLLVSLDKLSVLVQELLVIEAWKERLLPLLREHLAEHVDSSIAYLVLYHEAAVANLLEVVLYHRHACEAVDDDTLLELADWAVRKLAYLNSDAHKRASAKGRNLHDTLALTPLQELADKQAEVEFGAATCGLTILRYLTEHLPQLPLSVMSRLLTAHDAIMALLPLVDAPPWVRNRADGALEKFIDGRWQQVAPADRLKITQLDGQVWLSLVNLLVEPACRAKYNLDEYRRGCVLRLQRHLGSELLLDQLPVLRQLSRLLDEIALGIDGAAAGTAAGGAGAAARLVIEQVPVLREAITRGKDWAAIAQQQRARQFGPAARQLARQRLHSIMESFELLCQMEEQQRQQQAVTAPAGAKAAAAPASTSMLGAGGADEATVQVAAVRVVCSRQHASGLWEHWCEFSASVDASKPSDPVTISTTSSSGGAGGGKGGIGSSSSSSSKAATRSSAGSAGGPAIHGRRYRLAAIDPDSTRALPTKGKVAVHFMGRVAEALLQLPEVPLGRADAAAAAGVPEGVWLTVGLLAADGFALQLRLRKADKPKERDRVDGGWFAYHPVGGAISVLAPPPTAGDSGGSAGASVAAAGRARGAGITVLSSSSSGGGGAHAARKAGIGGAAAGGKARDVTPVKP